MNNINLDDTAIYQQNDPDNMLSRIKELPMQCRQAWQTVMDFNLPPDYSDVDKVIILGMGGSAIGGDLVRSLALAEARIPIIVHRDYGLPAFVDERTLVIASSYSGNTEETLSAVNEVRARGSKIVAITSGGKLKEFCLANDLTIVTIPKDLPPRAAVAFLFFTYYS